MSIFGEGKQYLLQFRKCANTRLAKEESIISLY